MTKVLYEKSSDQKDYEKQYIINPIKNLVPKAKTGRSRGIKLPEYIFFSIDNENNLHIDIKEYQAINNEGSYFMKNPVCENMQTDNAAFEGWAICLKSWIKSINKVKLTWAKPTEKNPHYNRFLYRVIRFSEAYSNWFVVDNDIDEIIDFNTQFCNLTNNSFKKPPREKRKSGSFGETEMEARIVNKYAEQMISYYGVDFVDRQFPVGLKKSGREFFPGCMSAIDLWGLGDNFMTIIELKYGKDNIKVGIISEIFFYSCVMRDMVKGLIAPPETTPKETEKLLYKTIDTTKEIKAEMLATDYHPLVENKDVFNLLNNNAFKSDIEISFNASSYNYDIEKGKLEIK